MHQPQLHSSSGAVTNRRGENTLAGHLIVSRVDQLQAVGPLQDELRDVVLVYAGRLK